MNKILFVFLLFVVLSFPAAAQSRYSFKVTGIRAKLFYDFAGEFSPEDIINDKGFTLFNTVIGEGDAAGMSETTLVLVEVTYGGVDDRNGPQLVFEAKNEKGRILERRSLFVGFVDKVNGLKKYVPFILYDTGCQQITVNVRLYKDKKPKSPLLSKMTKTIPFVCGE